MHALNYFVSSGIFMRQGHRTQRKQNHWDLREINNVFSIYMLYLVVYLKPTVQINIAVIFTAY